MCGSYMNAMLARLPHNQLKILWTSYMNLYKWVLGNGGLYDLQVIYYTNLLYISY